MSNESVYLYRALRAVRVRVRHRRRPARDARVVPTTGVEPGGERVYFNLCVGNSIDVVFCFCFYIFFCLQVIDERLDGVSFFADNPGVSGDFEKIFRRRGGCPDAAAVLSSMSANVDKATSGMREWRSVYALLSTASDVLTCEFLFISVWAISLTACFCFTDVEERFAALSPGGSVVPGTPPVVVKFLRASRGVRELRRVIASCVCVDSKEDADANTNYANGADLIINADDDRTTNAYAPRVRKGVCVDLDDARGLYERLPELLEKVRRTVVDKIPHVLRGRGVEDNLAVRLHFRLSFSFGGISLWAIGLTACFVYHRLSIYQRRGSC